MAQDYQTDTDNEPHTHLSQANRAHLGGHHRESYCVPRKNVAQRFALQGPKQHARMVIRPNLAYRFPEKVVTDAGANSAGLKV